MKIHRHLTAILLALPIVGGAQQVSETKYGLRVDAAGDNPTTEVTVYAPNIIRVTKYADGLKAMPAKRSFSVLMAPGEESAKWTVEGATLSTACVTVKVDEATGEVSFVDGKGNTLLAESAAGVVTPITEGVDKGYYRIAQSWKLGRGEAIYGLGQRRSPKLNQRGEDV